MSLTMATFLSLDGVMQAPGGPTEDPSGGFTHGGWVFPFFEEGSGEKIAAIFSRASAFLLGRRTYEIFAGHWPRVTDPADLVAARLNGLPKHVASRTLKEVRWKNASLLGADLRAEVSALKQRYPGELQVHGSCGLAQTLFELDLVDELNLMIFPLVLGSGRRLFGPGARPAKWKLVEQARSSTGVISATYRRDGAVSTGSFQLPE